MVGKPFVVFSIPTSTGTILRFIERFAIYFILIFIAHTLNV